MLWTISAVLVIFWLWGVGLNIAGSLIHFLLIGALIAMIISLVTERRTV